MGGGGERKKNSLRRGHKASTYSISNTAISSTYTIACLPTDQHTLACSSVIANIAGARVAVHVISTVAINARVAVAFVDIY